MKHRAKILTLLAGFFLLWSCSPGGAPATTSKATIQAANFTNAEGTIIGLEKKWAEAIVNRDMGTLNEIIADDFTGTAWSGDTYSKTKAVDDIEFRIYVAQALDLEGIKVKVFGDTAVVTLTQVEKSKYDNKDCSGRYGYSDVWLKRNGSWQAVSSYGRVEN
jgi:ketosteroid isomerase-like protein